MARHHYLPATFIGRFSGERTEPSRNRLLWANIGANHKIIATTPANIGFKKGLYNLASGKDIDKWSYEGNLSRILDAIAKGKPLSLNDYLRVAVPFVTGLFVRGKEFDTRYENMPVIKHSMEAGLVNPDNTNMSRTIRLQKMLAPVTGARWVVLHNTSKKTPIISNDLGLTMTQDMLTGDVGWAIPLDPATILGIFPQKAGNIAMYKGGQWFANITHVNLPPEAFLELNSQIAKCANEFVFGPTEQSVRAVTVAHKKAPEDLAYIMEMPWSKVFSGSELSQHDFEWFYLAAIANTNFAPTSKQTYIFQLEDVALGVKWSPSVLMLPGTPPPKSGIGFDKDSLHLDLS